MGSGGKAEGGGTAGQDLLKNTVGELTHETQPIRETLSNQFLEALNTGGIGAQIPIIGAMQEQSRMATDKALRGTENQLSAQGLARTPWAANTMAGVRQQGEMATSLIPSQIAQGFIGAAPSYAMAPVGAMIGGASSLATTQANRDIAKGNQTTELYSSMFKAAASAAASSCWIARRLFGDDSCEARLARYFIFHRWQGQTATVVRWAYCRYGKRVSCQPWIGMLRPLFEIAVRKAFA